MKRAAVMLIVTCLIFLPPASAHAGFFLFNIINDIFAGGSKNSKQKVTTPPKPAVPAVIKIGMNNADVAAVQSYLIKAAYLTGKADGVFGSNTLKAVKEFQHDTGLRADGVVGPQTMNALKSFRGTKPIKKAPSAKQPPAYQPPKKESGVPSYLYTLPVLATAYTRYDEGCTDYTYRGTYLRRGLMAVDPKIIPFGTRVYVPGYGEAIADDIGGAINGHHIDLAMDSLEEAFDWGAKQMTVYVLSD